MQYLCYYPLLTIVRSAICLSTLHAPSPPRLAKLSDVPFTEATEATDEGSNSPPINDPAVHEPDAILKLHLCGHEFHAECLVSWFVLRKTSCPICRAVYYSKETMQLHDEEAQLSEPQLPQDATIPPARKQLAILYPWGHHVKRPRHRKYPTNDATVPVTLASLSAWR